MFLFNAFLRLPRNPRGIVGYAGSTGQSKGAELRGDEIPVPWIARSTHFVEIIVIHQGVIAE
jgi:hypothetical protein